MKNHRNQDKTQNKKRPSFFHGRIGFSFTEYVKHKHSVGHTARCNIERYVSGTDKSQKRNSLGTQNKTKSRQDK